MWQDGAGLVAPGAGVLQVVGVEGVHRSEIHAVGVDVEEAVAGVRHAGPVGDTGQTECGPCCAVPGVHVSSVDCRFRWWGDLGFEKMETRVTSSTRDTT